MPDRTRNRKTRPIDSRSARWYIELANKFGLDTDPAIAETVGISKTTVINGLIKHDKLSGKMINALHQPIRGLVSREDFLVFRNLPDIESITENPFLENSPDPFDGGWSYVPTCSAEESHNPPGAGIAGNLPGATEAIRILLEPLFDTQQVCRIIGSCGTAAKTYQAGKYAVAARQWKRAAETLHKLNGRNRHATEEYVIAELECLLEYFATVRLCGGRDEVRKAASRIAALFESGFKLPEYLGARFLSELSSYSYEHGQRENALTLAEAALTVGKGRSGTFAKRHELVTSMNERKHAQALCIVNPVCAVKTLSELYIRSEAQVDRQGMGNAGFGIICASLMNDRHDGTRVLFDTYRPALLGGGPLARIMSSSIDALLLKREGKKRESAHIAKQATRMVQDAKINTPNPPSKKLQPLFRPDRLCGEDSLRPLDQSYFSDDELAELACSVEKCYDGTRSRPLCPTLHLTAVRTSRVE